MVGINLKHYPGNGMEELRKNYEHSKSRFKLDVNYNLKW
jgi:hypothetical protein